MESQPSRLFAAWQTVVPRFHLSIVMPRLPVYLDHLLPHLHRKLHVGYINHVVLQVCYVAQVNIVVTNTLIDSFFKTLVDHEVTVELKNDISIRGTLKSVDQYLNIKLDDIQVVEEMKYPHLVSPPCLPFCRHGAPRSSYIG